VRGLSALILSQPLLAFAQRPAPPPATHTVPSVSSVTPSALEAGRTYELILSGTGFAPGIRFAFGPGVELLGAAQVVDGQRATQRVRVVPGARPGPSFVGVLVGREMVRSSSPLSVTAAAPSAVRAVPAPSGSSWFRNAPRSAATQRSVATAPLSYLGPASLTLTIETRPLSYAGAGSVTRTVETGSLHYVGQPSIEKTVVTPPLHYLGGKQ
jgi:hypothetical protein